MKHGAVSEIRSSETMKNHTVGCVTGTATAVATTAVVGTPTEGSVTAAAAVEGITVASAVTATTTAPGVGLIAPGVCNHRRA